MQLGLRGSAVGLPPPVPLPCRPTIPSPATTSDVAASLVTSWQLRDQHLAVRRHDVHHLRRRDRGRRALALLAVPRAARQLRRLRRCPEQVEQERPARLRAGAGAGNTCVSATLDDPSTPAQLATLDLDGDVNADDKIYAGLHCITAARPLAPAPQEPQFLSGDVARDFASRPKVERAVLHISSVCARTGYPPHDIRLSYMTRIASEGDPNDELVDALNAGLQLATPPLPRVQ